MTGLLNNSRNLENYIFLHSVFDTWIKEVDNREHITFTDHSKLIIKEATGHNGHHQKVYKQ